MSTFSEFDANGRYAGRSTCMEAAYATRKQQLLEECQVAPELFHQVMPRLDTFMAPFVDTFCCQEPA